MSEDLKSKIIDVMKKSSAKNKKKLYVKDVVKLLPDNDRKEIQKCVKELVDERKLKYWSSGSTTYLVLPEDYDQMA